MRKYLVRVLEKLGFVVLSKKKLRRYRIADLEKITPQLKGKGVFLKAHANGGLREKLISENKRRWLEIGCGGSFDENFHYVDLFPESIVGRNGKYTRLDIVNASDDALEKLGKFDLIRMQHVFEHFSPENGQIVLRNCAKLLAKGGYLLISTPDLKKYVHFYLTGEIKEEYDWALTRIAKESPSSYYFSIFSHSVPYEKHEWCYDAEGLIYQLNQTGRFENIREITLEDKLVNIPFTHNRPHEDVCVIAQLYD